MIITSENLQKAIELQNEFYKLYNSSGIISVEGDRGIHVTENSFLETYTEYEVTDYGDATYPYLLKRIENGTLVYTLSRKNPLEMKP